jgi:hypothetical protein
MYRLASSGDGMVVVPYHSSSCDLAFSTTRSNNFFGLCTIPYGRVPYHTIPYHTTIPVPSKGMVLRTTHKILPAQKRRQRIAFHCQFINFRTEMCTLWAIVEHLRESVTPLVVVGVCDMTTTLWWWYHHTIPRKLHLSHLLYMELMVW